MAESDSPGPRLASGRAADVYDIGDGKVLRRYKQPTERLEYEARVMQWVADHGVRVPEVYEVDDRDLVMERIDGVTMMEAIEAKPWTLLTQARTMVAVQKQLNEVPAAEWMESPAWAKVPAGDRVLHLDLHPMNVMITPAGPVLIDWTNSSCGPAGFDAAVSYVEMATFETSGLQDRVGQKLLVAAFRRARGPKLIDEYLADACTHRLADSGLTAGEAVAVEQLRVKAPG